MNIPATPAVKPIPIYLREIAAHLAGPVEQGIPAPVELPALMKDMLEVLSGQLISLGAEISDRLDSAGDLLTALEHRLGEIDSQLDTDDQVALNPALADTAFQIGEIREIVRLLGAGNVSQ